MDPQKFVIPSEKLSYEPVYQSIKNGDVHQGCVFIDLDALFKAQYDLQEKYGQMHPVCLLVWVLSQHPEFNGTKFNIPIDIPSTNPVDRSVGFVFIRPDSFLKNTSPPLAFANYIQRFNEQAIQVRKRTGDNYLVVESSVLVPAWIMRLMLMIMPGALQEIIGTTNITILEGIECALSSLSDNICDCLVFSIPGIRKPYIGCLGAKAFSKSAKQRLKAVTDILANFESYITNLKD